MEIHGREDDRCDTVATVLSILSSPLWLGPLLTFAVLSEISLAFVCSLSLLLFRCLLLRMQLS